VQQGGFRTAVEPAEDIESLLASGAHAMSTDGDLLAGRMRFEVAHHEAERAGDTTAIAEAVLGLSGLWVHEHRTAAASTRLRERLRHALSLVDPMSSLALRLRARLAGEADYHAGEHTAILALLDEARQASDPVARAEVLSLAHHCLLGPDHGRLRRALAVELIGESFRTTRRADLLMGLLWQTVDLFLDAEPLAERRLGELRELLGRQSHLAVGFVVSAIDVMLAIRAGRFDEAEALAQRCAERGTAAGDVDATGWYSGQLFAIRWYQGRVAELLPMFDDVARSPTLSVVDNSFFAALAVAAATAGDHRKAAGVLAMLCGRDLADLPRSSTWLVTMSGVVEAAHLLDDPDTAARAYELLQPFADLPVIASLGIVCFGSVHHALGVASLTTGDLDRAVDHFREAVKADLAIAHWPAVVSARVRYAQALALRGLPEDAATRQRELATAHDEAAALEIPLPDHRTAEPPAPAAACVRQGDLWRIDWGRRGVLVGHSVGMLHLTVLLANPGAEIHALDLVAGLVALGTASGAATSEQPTVDAAALREYRQRLSDLRTEIDQWEAKDELARAGGARAERDWLIAEVVGGKGFFGRARNFSDSGERARIAVGKAIRRAVAQIAEADADIGRHLDHAVHTGIRCCYRPA
jgi:tetratricopeptide (TPR) repeat protein